MPMPRPCVNGHNESLTIVNESVDGSVAPFLVEVSIEIELKVRLRVNWSLTVLRYLKQQFP